MTIVELYSILIASGNSNRCSQLRNTLRSQLFLSEGKTGLPKIEIFKYLKKKHPEEFKVIAKELRTAIIPIFKDVNHIYIKGGNDEINEFRRLLEKSMIKGLWSGVTSGVPS